MENLINNPILSIDIGHEILHLLDDKSLQSCRMVNSSMKIMVGHPKFWLQKLAKKGLAQEYLMKWRNLVDLGGKHHQDSIRPMLWLTTTTGFVVVTLQK